MTRDRSTRPASPPSAVDTVLAEARRRIEPRLQSDQLSAEMRRGALVVDIRPESQRRRDGELAGSVVIERNVLEWRLDPSSPDRIPFADGADVRVVVVCDEGYASSLAAAALRDVGLTNATDLIGGYQAWLAFNRSERDRDDREGVASPRRL